MYDEQIKEGWYFLEKDDYGYDIDNVSKCKNCGRFRVHECSNGMRVCEKCNWCEEMNSAAPYLLSA